MGLFDILRYPVSDYPTTEELIRIPADLYTQWLCQVLGCTKLQYGDQDYYSTANMPSEIAKWPTNVRLNCVKKLRILIKSYEELEVVSITHQST